MAVRDRKGREDSYKGATLGTELGLQADRKVLKERKHAH